MNYGLAPVIVRGYSMPSFQTNVLALDWVSFAKRTALNKYPPSDRVSFPCSRLARFAGNDYADVVPEFSGW